MKTCELASFIFWKALKYSSILLKSISYSTDGIMLISIFYLVKDASFLSRGRDIVKFFLRTESLLGGSGLTYENSQ